MAPKIKFNLRNDLKKAQSAMRIKYETDNILNHYVLIQYEDQLKPGQCLFVQIHLYNCTDQHG